MEYEIGNIISILPATEMWDEFVDLLLDNYDIRLEDNNSWKIARIRDNSSPEDYNLVVTNTFNSEIEYNLCACDTELIEEEEDLNRPIVVGDRVTFADDNRIASYAEQWSISESEVVGTITREHNVKGAFWFKWDKGRESEDAQYGYDLRLVSKKHGVTPLPKTTFTQQYPFVKQCLEDMYGENYDIIEEEYVLNRLKADIILKFPEVTIRNSNNESHKIKDLYVKIQYRNNRLVRELEGFRGVLSAKEYKAHYAHSHLSSSNTHTDWTDFCLGSGTETGFLLAECQESFTEDNFIRLLAMIDSYVEYESIEGGPHIRMSDMNTSRRRGRRTYDSSSEYRRLKSQITEKLPLKYIHDDYIPRFEIDTNSPELQTIMNKYISVKSKRNKTNGEIFDDSREEVDVDRANRQLRNDYSTSITFRGQTIQKYVEELETEEIDMSVYEEVANPDVVLEVLEYLKEDLNKFIIG